MRYWKMQAQMKTRRGNILAKTGHLDQGFHLTASALISWHWVGGRTIAKTVKFDLHIIYLFRPDIVIVQLGTNDLTSCPPLQVGSAMEDFVHLLHDLYGVKGVSMCQTIRWHSAVVFNQRVDILTQYLRVVLEPIPYATLYWGHRGFWRARYSFFPADGIHLNSRGNISSIAASNERHTNLFEFLLLMATSNFLFLLFISLKCCAVMLICGPSPILFVSFFDVLG